MVTNRTLLPFDEMIHCNYNNANTRSVDEAGFSPCFRRNQKRVIFQCTSLAKTSEVDFYNRLRDVFPEVQFVRNVPGLHPLVTHLVVGDATRRTEKLLAALAAGRIWILPSDYLTTALNKRELPDERIFDLGASNNGHGPLRVASFDKRLGGEFNGWSVTVPIADLILRKKISQVLARGGATVHAWTLLHLMDNTQARSPLQDLTHVFVDPRQLIQDPNLSRVLQICDENPGRFPLKIVSYIYLEVFLSLAECPDVSEFDIRQNWLLQVHEEHRQANEGFFVHDYKTLGSPNMTMDPNHVEYKMDEVFATKKKATKANLLPDFEKLRQEEEFTYDGFNGSDWQSLPLPPPQALPRPVPSTSHALAMPLPPLPVPPPLPLPVPPPVEGPAVVTPFDSLILSSCVAAMSRDGGVRTPAPVFREGKSYSPAALLPDATKVQETTAWLRKEKAREEELKRPPVDVDAMLGRILKEERAVDRPSRSSQSHMDYVAVGADPVEEGEVSEDDETGAGVAYSPSSPPKNAKSSSTRRPKNKSNVVYKALSPKRSRGGRDHDDGGYKRRRSGGSAYVAASDSDSDSVIVLD